MAYTKEKIQGLLAGYNFHAKELVEGLTADQVYYSSKIPFAFNYADGAADYGECHYDAHGSHVAGIVAGNVPEWAEEQFEMETMGIAPEAQLVVLKVFDAGGGARFSSIARALEDAILLGVDCANLSLGSDAGAYYDEGITEYYEAACDAGINVVIAAGNASFSGDKSLWGNNMVKSSTVATGTVGSPGTYDPVLTVASAENQTVVSGNKVLSYLPPPESIPHRVPLLGASRCPRGQGPGGCPGWNDDALHRQLAGCGRKIGVFEIERDLRRHAGCPGGPGAGGSAGAVPRPRERPVQKCTGAV